MNQVSQDSEAWSEEGRVVRLLLERLDQHSQGERAHADRVAVYATATGHTMGIYGRPLRELRYAAQLHDIGKVRVDASVLSRLGTLEDEELAALRRHAELSIEILSEIDFLRPTVPIIRSHHERWDGRGYPDGLSGTDIPLASRIIAIVEAFDVLTIPPPWGRKISEAEALAELRLNAGTWYDPVAVEAFAQIQPLIQPVGL